MQTEKTKVFIEKARARHGDRYDYGKTAYVHSQKKVAITCSQHGDFEQEPSNHLRGHGCARCSGKHIYSAEEWVSKAKTLYGDRYDYGKVVYVRGSTKVIITCKDHGDFEQTPRMHLRGQGCARCSGMHNYSTEEWISKAKTLYGDRYDYGKVVYVRGSTKVIITCKKHGDFSPTASNFIQGSGCPKCSGRQRSTDDFVKQARKVHRHKYDYTKTVYQYATRKVTISCRRHGDFEQTARTHLWGTGCPRCPRRYNDPTNLYIMANNYDQVKIGYSIEPERRLSELNRDAPFSAELLKTWVLPDTPVARAAEAAIHQELAGYHAGLSGFDGATEWFDTNPLHAARVIKSIVEQLQISAKEPAQAPFQQELMYG